MYISNNVCIHGLSDPNWCALCKSANGDQQVTRIIKAFTPKNPKRHNQNLQTNTLVTLN